MEQTVQSSTRGSALSSTQARLWVLEQLRPGNAAQNVARGLRWAERIDQEVLETALNEVAQRHEILRTEFHTVDGAPAQVVLPPAPVRLHSVDLRHLAQEREARFRILAGQQAGSPFELNHGPLLRATV